MGLEVSMRFGIWVAKFNTKECGSMILPKPTCVYISSAVLDPLESFYNQEMFCKKGSDSTSVHTMFSKSAPRSRNPLWR